MRYFKDLLLPATVSGEAIQWTVVFSSCLATMRGVCSIVVILEMMRHV